MTLKDELMELAGSANSLHAKLANCHPSLRRGQVWCRHCGYTERVSSAFALKHGWPKHCGYTMTIDDPRVSIKGSSHVRG